MILNTPRQGFDFIGGSIIGQLINNAQYSLCLRKHRRVYFIDCNLPKIYGTGQNTEHKKSVRLKIILSQNIVEAFLATVYSRLFLLFQSGSLDTLAAILCQHDTPSFVQIDRRMEVFKCTCEHVIAEDSSKLCN